jgi:hypothetical protein
MADYGDAGINGVAGITKPYTDSGTGLYTAATNPTLSQVENWLDEISSELNIELGNVYFLTPVTEPAVTPALDLFANQQVAKFIEQWVRKRSSRGPTNRNATTDTFNLTDAVGDFVKNKRRGFESNGAATERQFVFKAFG